MSRSLLNAEFSMDMATFLVIVRKKQRFNWKMKRLNNGLKYINQSANRLIIRKVEEVMLKKAKRKSLKFLVRLLSPRIPLCF